MNSKEAAVAVILRRGRILLASNKSAGGWSLPGGRRDPEDREISDTLSRELREEISCNVASYTFLGSFPGTVDPTMVVHVFHVRVLWGEPHEVEAGTKLRWATFEELCADEVFGSFYAQHFPDGFGKFGPTRFIREEALH